MSEGPRTTPRGEPGRLAQQRRLADVGHEDLTGRCCFSRRTRAGLMRLRAGIVSLTVAAATIGGAAAWAYTVVGEGPQPGRNQVAAAGAESGAPGRLSPARPSPRPSPSSCPSTAGPVIEVISAPSGVKANGAMLPDADTGQILWGRDVDTERPTATLTKLMTALMVLENGTL